MAEPFTINSVPWVRMMKMERPDDIPEDIWDLCRYAWMDEKDVAPSAIGYDGWEAIAFAARRLRNYHQRMTGMPPSR